MIAISPLIFPAAGPFLHVPWSSRPSKLRGTAGRSASWGRAQKVSQNERERQRERERERERESERERETLTPLLSVAVPSLHAPSETRYRRYSSVPAPPNRSTPLYQLTAGYEWRGTETVGMSGVGTGGVVAGDEVDETVAIPINHGRCSVAPPTLCWTLQIHPGGERESGSQRQKERERQTDRDRDEERDRGTEGQRDRGTHL